MIANDYESDTSELTDYETNSGYLIRGTYLNLHTHINFIGVAVFKTNSGFDTWYYKYAYIKSRIGYDVRNYIDFTSKPGLVRMHKRKRKCCLFVCLQQGQHNAVCHIPLPKINHG